MDPTRRHRLPTILLALVLTAFALPAVAASDVLGPDGELYSLRVGDYGELFPQGSALPADHPVVAMEIARSDDPIERVLVPGTEGPEVERLPFLLLDDASDTAFLVWEALVSGMHPVLNIVSWRDGRWTEPVEVIHNPFIPKTSPRILVTRDSLPAEASEGTAGPGRIVLHLVWSEEDNEGILHSYYTPLILENGHLTRDAPVLSLENFEPALPESASATTIPRLVPVLQQGLDDRKLVVGFVSGQSGRFVTLELDVLPAEVARLADDARAHIIEVGHRSGPRSAGEIRKLADGARAHIIETGISFKPDIARSIGDSVRDFILGQIPDESVDPGEDLPTTPDIDAIGDSARAHIIEVGATLSDRGLRKEYRSEALHVVETARVGGEAAGQVTGTDLVVQLRAPMVRDLPGIFASDARLFVSASGSAAVIAWERDDQVRYVETRDDGWSRVLRIPLSETMSAEQAFGMLAERARDR